MEITNCQAEEAKGDAEYSTCQAETSNWVMKTANLVMENKSVAENKTTCGKISCGAYEALGRFVNTLLIYHPPDFVLTLPN